MAGSIQTAIVFILEVFVGLYIILLLVRLLLPWLAGATYNNAFLQGILAATSPVVVPIRRLVPPFGRLDTATLVVAYGFQYALLWLISVIYGQLPGLLPLAVASMFELLQQLIRLFLFAILIRVILSWIAPQRHDPVTSLIRAATDPILLPFQRIVPTIGGIDVSPIFAMASLGVIMILLGGVEQSLLRLLFSPGEAG